ncbi:hypothetical protein [Marinobacter sp.]|uniref:hypothetical protein n=1 Tax=Marinobacter sp. TaxID=50741 RepID=UPI003B517FE6
MELTLQEKAILREGGGANGLNASAERSEIICELGQELLEREWHRLLQATIDDEEAALLLGLSKERLRENIQSQELKLYTIARPTGSWAFPLWQFSGDGLIPHLDGLMGALSREVHPVTVFRFMTTENRDLEIDTSDSCLSPQEWLARGYDLDPVIVQVKDL